MLAEVVLEKGGKIIGHWPAGEYGFITSKALVYKHTFYGLALGEDNESHATEERIIKWVAQLRKQMIAFKIRKTLFLP